MLKYNEVQRETNCNLDIDRFLSLFFNSFFSFVHVHDFSLFVCTIDSSVILLFCLRNCNFDGDLIVFHCFSPHSLVAIRLFCSINCNFDVDLTVFHLIVWE